MSEAEIEKTRKELNELVIRSAEEAFAEPGPDPSTVENNLFCPENQQTKINYEASTPAGAPM
jgi:TPP-dependent pyruvate/acetoin dehydrogenase alpha subunit